MGNVASAGPVARSLEPQRNDAVTGAAAELGWVWNPSGTPKDW